MKSLFASIIIVTNAFIVAAIPPSACFANFRGEDCGREPQHVIYYWKPGSRCEVGIWRGCLPNPNMFRDQYECVSTCIFTVRAQPSDWHIIQQEDYEEMTTETTETTDSVTNCTGGTDGTGSVGVGGESTAGAGGAEGTGAPGGEGGGEGEHEEPPPEGE